MAQLYWQTLGEGDQDIVLLHGWGLNAEVWHSITSGAASQFRFHLVDLPGYGRSQGFPPMSLQQIADCVWAEAVKQDSAMKAIWLGWSLGGLVASQIALDHSDNIKALITVASSPCFQAQESEWPGIKPDVLASFQHHLQANFQRTVEQFLALQTLGTASARKDAKLLKSIILAQPAPSVEVLDSGLDILRTADLRRALESLSIPFLRIYGYLDGLVPRKIVPLLDTMLPGSLSVVMKNSAHAPFISHPDEFIQLLVDFNQEHQ
nr:pimeloyl-ACP methyl ester esterase BioH [uncultured Moellerella sp.]